MVEIAGVDFGAVESVEENGVVVHGWSLPPRRSDRFRIGDRARIVRRPAADGGGGLDEQDVDFALGDGSMLDAAGDGDAVSLAERDVAAAELDCEFAFDDEEELVFMLVAVPDEIALEFGDPDLRVVDLREEAGVPVAVDGGEGGGEVGGGGAGHGASPNQAFMPGSVPIIRHPDSPSLYE